MAVPVKVARQQTTPKPSETLELSAGTNRNPPEPSELASGTPGHIGILWNLPEPASGTYTITHRVFPEPSGTCLRNLHQPNRNPPEPSGTFLRNLLLRPARTGTHRSLSGLKAPLAYAVGE